MFLECLEQRCLLSASRPVWDLDVPALTLENSQYHPSRILVRYREDALPRIAAAGNRLTAADPELLSFLPGLREVVVDPGLGVDAMLKSLRADPAVLYAEPDFRVRLAMVPNDPLFGSLWGLHNTGQNGGVTDADIDAVEAWDVTTGSGNTIVAVIDTGVDYNHPDLAANIWVNPGEIPNNQLDDDGNGFVDDVHGYDFVNGDGDPLDDHFHGTHVAGTIGAVGNNGVGVAGVSWNVQIMALKFLDSSGSGYLSDALSALNYAVANGATISNNSWGGGGYSQALFDAIASAGNAGHIFVAAAGNASSDNDSFPAYPASYDLPNVVAVASSNQWDQLSYFSNYGVTSVDLSAPGEGILSTFPTYMTWEMQNYGFATHYETISGTSMATPHVAGVMALVRDQQPTWTADQVIHQVLSTVDLVPDLNLTATQGRLNAASAVGNAVPDLNGPRVTASTPSGFVGGAVGSVRFTFNEPIQDGSFTLADVVQFTGPGGIDLLPALTGVAGSGRTWTLSFTSQAAIGDYQIVIGPDILDLSDPANPMDQDRDGTAGEIPDDRYAASFTISEVLHFPSPDVPAPIFDWTATVSYLTIDQDVTIRDLNVQLDITHTFDGDLQFYLIAPWDPYSYVMLSEFRGGAGNNFSNTMFDDEAALAISQGTAPFSGSYRPETPLSAYDGRNARGTWQLWIEDWGFGDQGTLNAWSLWIEPGDGGPPPGGNLPPDAIDDYVTTLEDQSVVVPVLLNDGDPDGDPLVVTSITDVFHGVAVLNPDQTIQFTPDANFNSHLGTAGFTYTISDGRGGTDTALVWIEVAPVNDPPIAVDDFTSTIRNQPVQFNHYDGTTPYLEANDTDVDGDWLSVLRVGNPVRGTVEMDSWGIITFTPEPGYVGAASFEYVVTDGTDVDTGVVHIEVRDVFYLSTTAGGSLTNSDGTVTKFAHADILQLLVDGAGRYTYSVHFDGSDVGLSTSNENVDAFMFLPDGSILVSTVGSFSVPNPGGGSFSGGGEDLLRFWPTTLGDATSGYWEFYFDGSNVGLSGSNENIDAVYQLSDGRILISTAGTYSVPSVPTGTDADEDLLAFQPTTLGLNSTSGTWSLYFDGSDVDLATNASEDIDSLFVEESPTGGLPTLHFSTRGNFAVPGRSGANEDIFAFHPSRLGSTTQGTYASALVFDGSLYGLSSFDVDGFHRGLPPGSGPRETPDPVPGFDTVPSLRSARTITVAEGEGGPSSVVSVDREPARRESAEGWVLWIDRSVPLPAAVTDGRSDPLSRSMIRASRQQQPELPRTADSGSGAIRTVPGTPTATAPGRGVSPASPEGSTERDAWFAWFGGSGESLL